MLLKIKNSRVGPDEIADAIDSLDGYRKTLVDIVDSKNYKENEASLILPSDRDVYEAAEKVANEVVDENLKYILVIGIGGSNLGTKAIYEPLFGYFDVYAPERMPKMLFLDTNDTKTLQKTLLFLNTLENKEEFLINVVTKSGGTTETIANAEIIIYGLLEKFGEEVFQRVVVTSQSDSLLTKEAEKKGMYTLSIPIKVGGRYSVFSTVGVFPLIAAGIDVEALLHGATEMRHRCLDESVSKNIAMQSAAILYSLRKKGKTIHTSFIFHPELKSVGDWHRQLLAESIGKKENEQGNIVHVGITPEVSVGSTDLHSVTQLYLGGPKDKVTTFVSTKKIGGVIAVPSKRIFEGVVPSATDKTAEEIMNAILDGTKTAYEKGELPFMEAIFEDVSPYEIGQFMQFKMCETMYLGKLLGINAFNQPNIEDYKSETRNILEKK